jgi:predicted DNA-binding transcriptional regulator AlpA
MKQRNKQCKQCKPSAFGAPRTPAQLAQDRKDRRAFERIDKRYGVIGSMQMWLADRDYADAHRVADHRKIMSIAPRTQHRGRGEGSRSSAKSGDGNSSDDSDSSDSDPARRPQHQQHPLQLLDQSALATLLCVGKKTLQNRYSTAPHTLPPAIHIPGARGPRWTQHAVQIWLDSRPEYTAKPAPVAEKRRVGRPRIAATLAVVVGKGGAA